MVDSLSSDIATEWMVLCREMEIAEGREDSTGKYLDLAWAMLNLRLLCGMQVKVSCRQLTYGSKARKRVLGWKNILGDCWMQMMLEVIKWNGLPWEELCSEKRMEILGLENFRVWVKRRNQQWESWVGMARETVEGPGKGDANEIDRNILGGVWLCLSGKAWVSLP